MPPVKIFSALDLNKLSKNLNIECEDVEFISTGIQIKTNISVDEMLLEVDNCELYNWGYAATRIDGTLDDIGIFFLIIVR